MEVESVFVILADTLKRFRDRPSIILTSSFMLLILWGYQGRPLFYFEIPPLADALPMYRWWFTFLSGVVLLVAIPCAIIRFGFRESLAKFGLRKGNVRLGLSFLAVILAIGLPLFWFGTRDPGIRQEYPLFLPANFGQFILFELSYLLFFLALEFIFRGYLLFGLYQKFGIYAILIQMLSYTAWHLGKPTAELLGTPLWGTATAAVTLRVGSIWYVVLGHWLLNVFMDAVILYG
jgi:membrane protease YdiL (CAAX protease family)